MLQNMDSKNYRFEMMKKKMKKMKMMMPMSGLLCRF